MSVKLGLDAKLYRNTGTFASPAWNEVINVKDLTLNLEAGEADVTTRGNNGWRATVATLKDGSIEFEMVWDTADADFAKIMVNTVKAPTKNRHFLADATDAVKAFGLSSSDVDLGTTDLFTIDTVDAMRSVLDTMPLPPPGIQIPGDAAAEDSPLRLWLLSPTQFDSFAASSTYRTYQANAMARAAQAKQHPLFLGPDTALWNGFLLKKMPRPIRFYAGDAVKYCASATSETESSATVASALTSGTYAVDRSIILGGQAVAQALAASRLSGIPFFWSEKMLDHDDKVELLIGAIRGVSKVRFAVSTDSGDVVTDYGVTVVDTVVKTPGGVQ